MIVALLLSSVLFAPETPLEQAVARLGHRGAAALVIEARTGTELAASGWVDRALPPGSLFKLVTALTAGAHRPEALLTPLPCPAATIRCGAGGHGRLPLEEALAQSCNAYFGQLGAQLGTALLRKVARELGLGQPGGLPAEAASPAEAGAHGAGALLTARQGARLLRAIALGHGAGGQPLPGAEVLPRVRAGLRAAVERGTAKGAAGPAEPVLLAGKTGTAAAGDGIVGWFAGYGPASVPAIVVIVGLRGQSGAMAAQAARPIFEAYFHGR